MKLTYRGVSYEYNPPQVETTLGEVGGKYRGLEWRFRNPKKLPILQPTLDLVYRGVPVHQDEVAPVAALAVGAAPANFVEQATPVAVEPSGKASKLSVEAQARSLMMGHHKMIKNREQSLLSRAASEVGLGAQKAARYWNQVQGKINPSFRTSYDRSHVSLS